MVTQKVGKTVDRKVTRRASRLTTSGVPTPSKPPSDPINICRPVVRDDLEVERGGGVAGAARKEVFRATESGVERKAAVRPRQQPNRITTDRFMVVVKFASVTVVASSLPAEFPLPVGVLNQKRSCFVASRISPSTWIVGDQTIL